MAKIKTILWGYDKSAELKLQALYSNHNVVVDGLVIPTNRDAGIVNQIKNKALNYGISIYEPESLRNSDSVYQSISDLKPDIFIVDSYTKLIPQKYLDIPNIGSFNFHPGKLPEYRGAHVMNWAIINGEEEIALTVHRMNDKFDCGDILFQENITISFLDDINIVFEKVCKSGVELTIRLINAVKNNSLDGSPQMETNAKHYKARTPDDGKIDWHKTNIEIFNLIRALKQPWPSAFFTYKDKMIRVHEAYPVSLSVNNEPGTVVSVSKSEYCVATGSNSLLIKEADRMDFSVNDKLC